MIPIVLVGLIPGAGHYFAGERRWPLWSIGIVLDYVALFIPGFVPHVASGWNLGSVCHRRIVAYLRDLEVLEGARDPYHAREVGHAVHG